MFDKIKIILSWVFKEVLFFNKPLLLKVFIFDGLNVAFQTFALTAVFLYVKNIDNGHIELFGYSYKVTGSLLVIVLLSLIFSIMLIFSGFFMYLARSSISRLTRLYEEYTLVSLYRTFFFPQSSQHFPSLYYTDKKYFLKFMTQGPHYLGRIYMEGLTALIPTCAMSVAFIVMVYLDAKLTLLLSLLLISSVPFYLLLNKKAYEGSIGLKENAKGHSMSKTSFYEACMSCMSLSEIKFDENLPLLFSEESVKFLDSYEIRLKITHLGLMYANIVGSILFFTLFVYVAYMVNYFDYRWSMAFLFFIPLKYFVAGLRSSFKLYTKFYTFLPYFRPYLDMRLKKKVIDKTCLPEKTEDTIRVEVFSSGENINYVFKRGVPLYICNYTNLDRTIATYFSCCINAASVKNGFIINEFTVLENICKLDKDSFLNKFQENYNEIVLVAKSVDDYQILATQRLKERIDNNELLSEEKCEMIYKKFSPEIQRVLPKRQKMEVGPVCFISEQTYLAFNNEEIESLNDSYIFVVLNDKPGMNDREYLLGRAGFFISSEKILYGLIDQSFLSFTYETSKNEFDLERQGEVPHLLEEDFEDF